MKEREEQEKTENRRLNVDMEQDVSLEKNVDMHIQKV